MRGGWSFRGPCSEELAVSADQDCHQVLDEGSSCQEDGMRKIWLWMSLVQALQTSQRVPQFGTTVSGSACSPEPACLKRGFDKSMSSATLKERTTATPFKSRQRQKALAQESPSLDRCEAWSAEEIQCLPAYSVQLGGGGCRHSKAVG